MNRRKTLWSKAMTKMNPQQRYEIGMVGLGVMGRNLLLNMADHGHSVAGYDKDATKVAALRREAENRDVLGAADDVAGVAAAWEAQAQLRRAIHDEDRWREDLAEAVSSAASWGPVIAATAPTCAKAFVQLTLLMTSRL